MTMNDDYLKKFHARVSTLDDVGANILENIPCLLRDELKKMLSTELEDAAEKQLNKTKKFLRKKCRKIVVDQNISK